MTWLEELCNDPYLGINAYQPPREEDYTHCIPFFDAPVPTDLFNPFELDININQKVKKKINE